jgi:TetR/AcrR family tetracycline transcriptional repressor
MASRARKKRPSGRPKERALTEERIVAAALQLIDSSELASFSLRDVARSLNVYPTAIYWYVKSRDELLGKVVAYATRDVIPPSSNTDWKVWLRDMCHRYRRAIQKHPNIAPLIGSQMRSNAGIRADFIDGVLTALAAAGFPDERIVDAYNVIIGALVGFICQELAALPAENQAKWAEAHRKRVSMLDVIQHQALARHLPRMANKAFIVRWSNGTEVPLDTSFDLFIDVIILGLEQTLKARR